MREEDPSPQGGDEPVAARVRELLFRTGMSKRELAASLGLSEGYISQVARGLKRPGTELLFALRRRLGVSVDWLIDGEGGLYSGSRIRPELYRGLRMQIATVQAAVIDKDPDAVALLELIREDREDATGDQRFQALVERISPDSPEVELLLTLYDEHEWASSPASFRKSAIEAATRYFEALPAKDKLSYIWARPRSGEGAPQPATG